MTTENQIQVNLQKFKNGKQNLGAIEDAISEVKNQADLIVSRLSDIKDAFYSEVEDAVSKILEESDYMVSAQGSAQTLFEEKLNELNSITEELTSLNIDFDNGDLEKIKEEMQNLVDASFKISSLNEATFYI